MNAQIRQKILYGIYGHILHNITMKYCALGRVNNNACINCYKDNTALCKKHRCVRNDLIQQYKGEVLHMQQEISEHIDKHYHYFKNSVFEELMQAIWHPKNFHKFSYLE